MKKLGKKMNYLKETIEAYCSCNCLCGCTCSCGSDVTLHDAKFNSSSYPTSYNTSAKNNSSHTNV